LVAPLLLQQTELNQLFFGAIGEPEPGLDIADEDLASDEATWPLYENWCKVYNKERDSEDMTRRFPIFKAAATYVHKLEDGTARLGKFADGPDEGSDLRAWEALCTRLLYIYTRNRSMRM
jgi:hypothetical protein